MDRPHRTPFRASRSDQAFSWADTLTVASSGFILGAFVSPSGIQGGVLAAVFSAIACLLFLRNRFLIPLIAGCTVFCGCLYAIVFQDITGPRWHPDSRGVVDGLVVNDPSTIGRSQRFTISLRPPARGSSEVIAERFPEASYGDHIRIMVKNVRPAGDRDDPSAPFFIGPITIVGVGEGSSFHAWLIATKRRVLSGFRERLPADAAALLGGLILGDRASFSPAFTEAMRKSGTTHLVAISGYNIGLVVLGVGSVLRRFLAPRIAFAMTIIAIAAFTVMVGAEASVVRAAIMGGLFLFMRLSSFRTSIWRIMALAAAAMTLVDPSLPRFDLGFQLSFLSLAGLILLEPIFHRLLRADELSSPLGWREALAASSAAQAMVMPVLMHAFGATSLAGLLANVVILPAVPPTMALGFLAAVLGITLPHLAVFVLWSAYGLLSYMLVGITLFGALGNYVVVPFPGEGFIGLYYAGLLLFVRLFQNKRIDSAPSS